jgi:hypothetical protein
VLGQEASEFMDSGLKDVSRIGGAGGGACCVDSVIGTAVPGEKAGELEPVVFGIARCAQDCHGLVGAAAPFQVLGQSTYGCPVTGYGAFA